MPFNGAGTYLPAGADYPVVSLTVISSLHYNNVVTDMSTGISTCVAKDGQTVWTANLPAGGFKLTGLGAGTARTDSARIGDVQDGLTQWAAAGGTADAITATYSPPIATLVDGQLCAIRASAANATTTPTFSPNGLTAHTISQLGGRALPVSAWAADSEIVLRYKLANTRWEVVSAILFGTGTDGQALSVDSTQGSKLVYIDNPSRPILNINPDNLIDQINEGALYTVNAADVRGPDGVSGTSVGAGVFKLRKLADPANAARKVIEITCTTADAAIAATDDYFIYRAIEGYNSALLMPGTATPQPLTIQFRFQTSVTGVYGVSVANSALNRRYIGTITVVDAAIHEYTVTLTMDTTGTWLYTNGVGMYARLCLAAGSNFQSTAGVWAAGAEQTTVAQANFMSNTANIAYLGSFHIIPGQLVQAYQPADIQKELARSQRYYFKTYEQGVVAGTATLQGSARVGASGNAVFFNIPYKSTMRADPTTAHYSPVTGTVSKIANQTTLGDINASASGGYKGSNAFELDAGTSGSVDICAVHCTADARLS